MNQFYCQEVVHEILLTINYWHLYIIYFMMYLQVHIFEEVAIIMENQNMIRYYLVVKLDMDPIY